MRTGSFPGVKSGRGVTLTPHPLLVPWSRKSRAILLLPYGPYGLYRTLVPVQACTIPYLMHYLGPQMWYMWKRIWYTIRGSQLNICNWIKTCNTCFGPLFRHHQVLRLKSLEDNLYNPYSFTIDMSEWNETSFLGAFAKLRLLASSCLSVCPHGTTRLPLDVFSRNLISKYFFF